jgi:para-aminobenzoate synthetase component 1
LQILNIAPDSIANQEHLKQQLLHFSQQYTAACLLDNHTYASPLSSFNFLWAAGCIQQFTLTVPQQFSSAADFLAAYRGNWVFGHLAYSLGGLLHGIHTTVPSADGFAPLSFFVPQYVVKSDAGRLQLIVQNDDDPYLVWQQITHRQVPGPIQGAPVIMQPRLTREAYIEKIEALRRHILRGDCYEINFCQEFFAEQVPENLCGETLYQSLVQASPNPFAAYYRQQGSTLMCASPERFLAKRGNRLISQPIKGTAPRNPANAAADRQQALDLRNSTKERSENVMVVDLVRNDLSQICLRGTVQVDELFGVYSYPQVHQMISTVSGRLADGVGFIDILKAVFPMGSMTGAPKNRVMQLIDAYEGANRGLFSGSVGYFSPDGDFDFNVVIRSLLYNNLTRYLSYQVGSGITWYSKPASEYEECLLKAKAIQKVLAAGEYYR